MDWSKVSEKEFENDLKFIENEIISMQPDIDESIENEEEKYKFVKFSKALNGVAVINLTKKQFKNYWRTLYKDSPQKLKIILEKIDDKFENGLTSRKEMIEIIKKSNDYESEKKAAIKALTKKENKNERYK